jgi:hypothetical protein
VEILMNEMSETFLELLVSTYLLKANHFPLI